MTLFVEINRLLSKYLSSHVTGGCHIEQGTIAAIKPSLKLVLSTQNQSQYPKHNDVSIFPVVALFLLHITLTVPCYSRVNRR